MKSRNMREILRNAVNVDESDNKFAKKIFCKPSKDTEETFVDETGSTEKKNLSGRDVLNNYLECSSVHGVQYFGNLSIKVGYFGKIIWACTMITGFICSTLMVIQFLHRYYDNPTNTFIKTFFAPIYLVPFPAVTLCPFTPPPLERRLSVMKGIRIPENVSNEDVMFVLKYAHDLSYRGVTDGNGKYMKIFQDLLYVNEIKLFDFMKLLRPCKDMFVGCWWNNEWKDCSTMFKISHSDHGTCCSFNYLLEDYIDLEIGAKEPEPVFTNNYGPRAGLKVLLHEEVLKNDEDPHAVNRISNSNGILISVHHSLEFPDEINARILQAGRELQIRMNPSLYIKPAGLYYYNEDHETVQICIPNNSKVLKYFPKYRYSNCYANCRIMAMLKFCGCVPYTYHMIVEDHNINSCELDLSCIYANLENIRILKDVEENNFTCSCRTPCENVVYDGVPVAIQIEQQSISPNYQNATDGRAVLRVFMSSDVFNMFETIPAADEIYLLASIGGIFSLFLGCSFLSAVEILYFVFLLYRAFLRRRFDTPTQKKKISFNDSEMPRSYF